MVWTLSTKRNSYVILGILARISACNTFEITVLWKIIHILWIILFLQEGSRIHRARSHESWRDIKTRWKVGTNPHSCTGPSVKHTNEIWKNVWNKFLWRFASMERSFLQRTHERRLSLKRLILRWVYNFQTQISDLFLYWVKQLTQHVIVMGTFPDFHGTCI